MSLWKSLFQEGKVEFFCAEEDYGVIPPPIPARNVMPEWYKHLAPKINNENKLKNSTIKRCAPFLDAMVSGWIIPLAADVEIATDPTCGEVKYQWLFHKPMIENHSKEQVGSDSHPNPNSPKPPMKFINYIGIKIPEGYSALFVPPLNRPDPRFQCIAGMVDDTYMGNGALEFINFPFFFNTPNYTGLIKAGTPLVQMILIKRDDVLKQSRNVRYHPMNAEETALITKTRRLRNSQESYYRDKLWERK